jgi:hypothetical protein
MAQDDAIDAPAETAGRPRSFWRRWIIFPLLLILGLAFLALWIQRERIAGDVLGSTLESYGVPATYEIERIGGRRQVLSNIVVGDPARPDLTVERAEIVIRYRFGLPAIASVRLVRPRLYGTLYGGKLSFGALDPLLFPDVPARPFEFPDMRLALVDGRALLESDYGPVGFKAEGSGHLRGGFAGRLAASAPELAFGTCEASGTTLYGTIKIDAERPAFSGPLRLRELDCGDGSLALAETNLNAGFRLDRDLKGIESTLAGETRDAALAGAAAERLALEAKATFRKSELTASYELTGAGLAHEQVRLAAFALGGTVRAGDGFDRARVEGEFEGRGFRPGPALDRAFGEAAASMDDTLLGPVLRKVRGALAREAAGSSLDGRIEVRKTGDVVSVVVPQAHLTGGSGQRLVALSRFQYGWAGRGLPRLSGNFSTGGRDLPRIEGRIERRGTDGFTARLAMAEYAAEGARLAIPSLALVSTGEDLGFSGNAVATGRLPGGEARNLRLPLSGNWSSAGGLNLWRRCIDLRFDALRLANLTLERRGLRLCPARGAAIVRYGASGLRVAAGAPSLDVAGRLGETPIAIRSGAVGIAYPGAISARRMVITLGPRDTATTFAVEDLTANIGRTISGRFAGTDVRMFAVPLDLLGASGNWDYSGGVLSITDGDFRLVDRQPEPRFEPLVARGGTLTLEDNMILAAATLREPGSDRVVTEVDIRHDLATGRGHADLAVPGLLFDRQLQPETLSRLMLGVVANARGTVTGSGRIDWDEQGATSSGRFSSESLDFAAAVGPVKGASGTVVFTDLLGLTTAPDQRIRVASINPGIEIFDGEIGIEFREGRVLALTGGTWPFMGGTLTMRPVTLNLGESEVRAYVLDIEGMEAARVVERLELSNISANGTFDGTVPLIFDAQGNGRLVGGLLTSRGGGNISYVGALTYEDMGAVANFAFQALKSLDYKRMTVTINGPLTGEIITQVNFDGVSQGVGAKQNFITRRLAHLPIRFVINIRAAFYQLISNLKSLYDPASVRDPRELGLIDAEGNVIRRETEGPPPEPVGPEDIFPDEPAIQRRESEEVP